ASRDLPRRAEHRIDERTCGGCVETVLERHPRDAGVAEVLRHDQRRDRDTGSDVPPQPAAVVLREPIDDREEATHDHDPRSPALVMRQLGARGYSRGEIAAIAVARARSLSVDGGPRPTLTSSAGAKKRSSNCAARSADVKPRSISKNRFRLHASRLQVPTSTRSPSATNAFACSIFG